MGIEAILKLLTDNPITVGVIGTALATVAAFFRPILRALQKAMVRRIDQAWPDGEDTDDEAKVQAATKKFSQSTMIPIPRALVEAAVRNHKSIPPKPPKG